MMKSIKENKRASNAVEPNDYLRFRAEEETEHGKTATMEGVQHE